MVALGWAGGVCACFGGSVLVEVTADPYCMRVVVVLEAEVVVLAEVVSVLVVEVGFFTRS